MKDDSAAMILIQTLIKQIADFKIKLEEQIKEANEKEKSIQQNLKNVEDLKTKITNLETRLKTLYRTIHGDERIHGDEEPGLVIKVQQNSKQIEKFKSSCKVFAPYFVKGLLVILGIISILVVNSPDSREAIGKFIKTVFLKLL